jgi:tetratricopeptide (TPR) repeat protein
MQHLIEELKRRNVFRACAAYMVLAWLFVQVADILLDAFEAPPWAMRTILVAIALGFPITFFLAWAFEITATGVKRTEDVAPGDSITPQTGRKLNFVVIGILAVAVALFAIDKFAWRQFESDRGNASNDYAIAILPFHLDSGANTPLFGQLSDEIAQLLRRSDKVRLASQDAVLAVVDDESLADVAARLGVRYILVGVVSLDGDGSRLSVSLFDTETDSDIWTTDYEDTISQQMSYKAAQDLLAAIGATPLATPPITPDARAYELYLKARQHLAVDRQSEEAEGLLRDAISLDPRFAGALAGLCSFLVDRYRVSSAPQDFEEAERLCYRAWRIDSNSIEVQHAMGDLYFESGQLEKARESFAAALAINPNDFDTEVALAETYHEENPALAENLLKKIIQQQPGSPSAYMSLQYLYFKQGRYAEAVEQQRWTVRLLPDDEGAKFRLSSDLLLAGMFSEAKDLLTGMLASKSPKSGDIENNLATVLFFEGDYAGAAKLYQAAVEREPRDPSLYRNLADAIWHLEGKDAARPILLTAIELAESQLAVNPDDYAVVSTLMVAYASIGELANFQMTEKRLRE